MMLTNGSRGTSSLTQDNAKVRQPMTVPPVPMSESIKISNTFCEESNANLSLVIASQFRLVIRAFSKRCFLIMSSK